MFMFIHPNFRMTFFSNLLQICNFPLFSQNFEISPYFGFIFTFSQSSLFSQSLYTLLHNFFYCLLLLQFLLPYFLLPLFFASTVFNIYRPPTSSNYSQKSSVFLDEFASLLSLAVTTPNEFVLVGDFNVHVDTPSYTFPSSFLNLLSSVNLVQHVNFPTHIENHTLDLLITSTASLLSPKVSRSAFNITDH